MDSRLRGNDGLFFIIIVEMNGRICRIEAMGWIVV